MTAATLGLARPCVVSTRQERTQAMSRWAELLTAGGGLGVLGVIIGWLRGRRTDRATVDLVEAQTRREDAQAADIVSVASARVVQMIEGRLAEVRDEAAARATAQDQQIGALQSQVAMVTGRVGALIAGRRADRAWMVYAAGHITRLGGTPDPFPPDPDFDHAGETTTQTTTTQTVQTVQTTVEEN